jgi:hypothetical protein
MSGDPNRAVHFLAWSHINPRSRPSARHTLWKEANMRLY